MVQQTTHSVVRRFVRCVILSASVGLIWFPPARAARIPEALHCERGLVVFVGFPANELLASVCADREGLVQVLVARGERGEAEASMRLSAADHDMALGGRTTVLEYDGRHLPYCDNSVNGIVLTGPTQVPRDELMRVLAPRGTLVTADGKTEDKPWPGEMDEWTHYLHDATIEKAHRGLTGQEDARLLVLTKSTGREEANIPLPSSPVFDGVIAASGRLYICREDGVVSCFGEK